MLLSIATNVARHALWARRARDEEVVMGPLQELLAADQRQTLEFFFLGLQDVSEPSVDRQELLYNASVLAHYAQVSTTAGTEMPAPASLTSVFDRFVLDTSLLGDSLMMETAGAQCLLLTGFFERQMRGRHSIQWYASLGSSFFVRAAAHARSRRRSQLLESLALGFESWRQRHARLSQELHDLPYLLIPPIRTEAHENPGRLM